MGCGLNDRRNEQGTSRQKDAQVEIVQTDQLFLADMSIDAGEDWLNKGENSLGVDGCTNTDSRDVGVRHDTCIIARRGHECGWQGCNNAWFQCCSCTPCSLPTSCQTQDRRFSSVASKFPRQHWCAAQIGEVPCIGKVSKTPNFFVDVRISKITKIYGSRNNQPRKVPTADN